MGSLCSKSSQNETTDKGGSGNRDGSTQMQAATEDSRVQRSTCLVLLEEHPDLSEDVKRDMVQYALNKTREELISYMFPDPIVDGLMVEDVLSDIQARDIHETPLTTNKNKTIIGHLISKGWYEYFKFKQCLLKEKSEHCVKLLQIQEEKFLSDMVQYALNKTREELISYMFPDPIVDGLMVEDVLSDIQARDIHETPLTTNKTKAIIDHLISKGWYEYFKFKQCLLEEKSEHCVKLLEIQEEKFRRGNCSTTRSEIHDDPDRNKRRNDLRNQLYAAYRKHCGSMSIYPLRPNLARPCECLYVSQEMLEKDPRGPKKPRPDITDKFEPSHEQKDKKVNILNDVFYTDNKLCKNIYITGEAGVGKSTFCDYIVNMWLAAHTRTTVNYTKHYSQDLETMKQFPLLFYVQLKGENLDLDTDLYANLIEKQWDLDTSVKEFLTEEHCVIIADALDECTSGIPKRGVWNNSTVLTTSRPWKLETLRTDIEGSKIDKHIEIVCLDEKSVETLTEKILPVLVEESETTVKNSDNFIKEMKEKGLESFLRIPVLLIQILCLWHDNVTIGKSKTSIYCNLVHHQIQVYIKKLSAKDQKKLLPNSETLSPVNCKVSRCLCRALNEMLLKVGKMALNTLLSGKREYELVFDHNITEFHKLCEQEIETCLAIGILSQHKLFGKITKLEKFISFVHKSNQEFFASIYLACKKPISKIREVLANYIYSLDEMLKLEKIIMFVSGLNREMGREMANLLLEAAGRDPRIQEHRQTVDWRHIKLVSNVHNVILAAVEECRHNPHELQQKFRLDDIYVDEDNVSRVLSCFPVMEISRPASITMRGGIFNNHNDQVDAVMSHVQNTAGLQKVYLWNCTIGSRETAVNLVPQSLCVLDLSHVNLPHEALTTLSHNLKTTKLRGLDLGWLTCGSHGELEDGKCGVTFDLTRQSHLEKLRIWLCDMSGWSLPTATPHMKRVDLSCVTIPGAMLSGFLRGLPQTGVSVELDNVTVRPAGDFVSCLEQLRGSRRVERDIVEGRGEGELFVGLFEFINKL